jgi:hypothetical protein
MPGSNTCVLTPCLEMGPYLNLLYHVIMGGRGGREGRSGEPVTAQRLRRQRLDADGWLAVQRPPVACLFAGHAQYTAYAKRMQKCYMNNGSRGVRVWQFHWWCCLHCKIVRITE